MSEAPLQARGRLKEAKAEVKEMITEMRMDDEGAVYVNPKP